MKHIPGFSILVSSVLLSSLSYAAGTPLKLSAEALTIHGSIEAGVKGDGLAFYVPAGTLNKSHSLAGCKFPEDQSSPNGAGKFVKIEAAQTPGKYSLKIPVKGLRGLCEYVLETLYLDFKNEKVLQTFTLMTKSRVESINKDLKESNLDPMEVPLFKDLQKIFCEFDTAEPVGLCQTSEGHLPELNYQISNTQDEYILDVQSVK